MSEDKPGNKPNQGRWQKGESGNPNGRPKGYVEFKEKCRGHSDEALAALVAALDDKEYRVAAGRVLLEFGWGKPVQAITGEDGQDIRIVIQKLAITDD